MSRTTPDYESLQAAAVSLGCSMPTVYSYIKAGKLKSYRVGRSHRVHPQDVDECIRLLARERRDAERAANLNRKESLRAALKRRQEQPQ